MSHETCDLSCSYTGPKLCKGTESAIGFHSFGFSDFALLHPVCEVGRRGLVALRDELLVGPVGEQRPRFPDGACPACFLPGPFGRPTGRPEACLVRRASFVRAEINPRSTSAAIENIMAMILPS